MPVAAQIREREAFIERGEETDCQNRRRTTGRSSEFGERENKLNQLRAFRIPQQEQPISSVPDSSAEVQRLQTIVSQLQRHLEQSATGANPVGCEKTLSRIVSRRCNNGCSNRQQDLQEATLGRQTWGGDQNIPVDGSRRPRMERREHRRRQGQAAHSARFVGVSCWGSSEPMPPGWVEETILERHAIGQ